MTGIDLESVIADALHNVPGVECDHIDGMQPTCESDAAHVAAVLRDQIAEAQADAWKRGYRSGGSDRITSEVTPNPYRAALVAPSRVPSEET